MKYPSYSLIALTSTGLACLLSLSACSPKPKATTTQSMTMNHSPQMPTSQAQEKTPSSSHAANATVKIHNFKFEPANLTIAVGETVQFINNDEEPHTVTATDGTFNSKALDTNQTWSYTATKPGTYPYICSIHPFMKGTLTITSKKN